MAFSTRDPLRMRTALLACSGLALLIAVGLGCPLSSLTRTPAGVFGSVLMIIGGLLAAMGVKELAAVLLRPAAYPWYTAPGAVPFLVISLLLFNLLFLMASSIPFKSMHLNTVFPGGARFFVALASELFWIVALDWAPGLSSGRQIGTGQRRPLFKPFDKEPR